MTVLQSGHITSSALAPDGGKRTFATDHPYITKDDFINTAEAIGLGIDNTHPLYLSGELDKVILRASGAINRICRRYFHTQTIWESRTGFSVRPFNPQLVTMVLANSPYQKINQVWIQVLKWFIQIDTSSQSSYLQDFPDLGYYKIVPLLSSSGQGAGSPIPAAILDHVMLGVLWTNYTFGYGTALTGETVNCIDNLYTIYQICYGNRLISDDQTFNVYKNGVLVNPSLYSVEYTNGIITFDTPNIVTDVITADFTTNQSVPADIQEACVLLTSHFLGQAISNPLGATSFSIQTFSISWGDKSEVKKRVMECLESYIVRLPKII